MHYWSQDGRSQVSKRVVTDKSPSCYVDICPQKIIPESRLCHSQIGGYYLHARIILQIPAFPHNHIAVCLLTPLMNPSLLQFRG